MMNLSQLNGITATIIACANCGLSAEKCAAKLTAKYGMESGKALALVRAILAVV